MVSYGDCNVAEDAAVSADTETSIHTVTMPRDAVIKQILYSFGAVVDAKAATGYLELKHNNLKGPFRFPIGHGNGGATNTAPGAQPGRIDVDIPAAKADEIELLITLNEAAVDAHAGIVFVG